MVFMGSPKRWVAFDARACPPFRTEGLARIQETFVPSWKLSVARTRQSFATSIYRLLAEQATFDPRVTLYWQGVRSGR
jgi:hypothetical protein